MEEKKPFHEVILGKMEEQIPLILSSSAAEMDLRKYGNILRDSIIPKEKANGILLYIQSMQIKLGYSNDTKSAQKYLRDLSLKIYKRFPASVFNKKQPRAQAEA